MPKVADQLEELLKKQDQIQQLRFEEKIGIFLWGLMCGVVLSYSYFLPLFIGFMIGYAFGFNSTICIDIFNKLFNLLKNFEIIKKFIQ